MRQEPDGDLHILLATRPALVNAANDQYEHGDLVLEEICQGSVTQADAVAACQGVPHDLTVCCRAWLATTLAISLLMIALRGAEFVRGGW